MFVKRSGLDFARAAIALLLAAAPARAACQLHTVAELPLTMQGDTPLVDATINGRKLTFVIDTGAYATLISFKAAAELKLKPSETHESAYGVGGMSGVGQVTIAELKLGSATVHNINVRVEGPGLKSAAFAGLIGEDILSRTDLELDFANGLVRLIQPKGCAGDEVVFWPAKAYSTTPIAPSPTEGELQTYVLLNGRRVLATLDTGAYASIVTTGAAARAGVTPQSNTGTPAQTVRGIGRGEEAMWTAVFSTLSVGDETMRNARLRIADLFNADNEVSLGSHIPRAVAAFPQMLLGADFVRAHHIYIARSQGLIYFTYNGGPIFQAEPTSETAPAKP